MRDDQEPREWETHGTQIGPFVSAHTREVTPEMRRQRQRDQGWGWIVLAVLLLFTGNWLIAILAGIWGGLSVASAMTQTPTKENDR